MSFDTFARRLLPRSLSGSSGSQSTAEEEAAGDEELELRDIRKGNEAAYELYRQFVIDVPRMDMYVDGKFSRENPTSLFMCLWDCFGLSLHNCTQTALVSWFERGRKHYCSGDDEHLLDGGRQTVEICTKQGLITVKKPFRVVRVGLEPLDLATIQLVITYDSSNNCKRNAWYVEPIVDAIAGIKTDWILVDQ